MRRFQYPRGISREIWLLALVLFVYVSLGIYYAVRVPAFEAPGELWHYARVVRFLGLDDELPLSTPDVREASAWVDIQPPLYYAVAGRLMSWLGIDVTAGFSGLNRHASLGDPTATANHNAVFHLDGEHLPFYGVYAALHVMRLLSLFASVFALLAGYSALRLAGVRPPDALGGLIAGGFLPGFVFYAAGAQNGVWGLMCSLIALALAVGIASGRHRGYGFAFALGVAVALAVLCHLYGILCLGLIPLAYGIVALRDAKMRGQSLVEGLLALGTALGVSAWWWAEFVHSFAQRVHALGQMSLLRVSTTGEAFRWLADSYFALWGWMNLAAPRVIYAWWHLLALLAIGGLVQGLLYALWKYRRIRITLSPTGAVLLLWTGGILLAFSLFLWKCEIVPLQLLYWATPGLSLVFWAGWRSWCRMGYRNWMLPAFGLVMALVAGAALPISLDAVYARPQFIEFEALPADMVSLDLDFGDVVLLGYQLESDSVKPGGEIALKTYWTVRRRVETNYSARVAVYGLEDDLVSLMDIHLGNGVFPTRWWLPGQVAEERWVLHIDSDAKGPTVATIRLSVYGSSFDDVVRARDPLGRLLSDSVAIGHFRLEPRQRVVYRPFYNARYVFGERIALLGFDVYPTTPVAGQPWEITLYWQALHPIPTDYTVFIHLLDEEGQLVAQGDAPPVKGYYPTTFWQPGEQIRDGHLVVVPADLVGKKCSLAIGLYRPDTGARLPVIREGAENDHVLFGWWRVGGR